MARVYFSKYGYNRITGMNVPVLESKAAAAHIAYSLANLNRQFGISTSRHSTFKSLPPEIVKFSPITSPGGTSRLRTVFTIG